MWSALFGGIGSIFNGWVKVKVSKQEAQAKQALVETKGELDWDNRAMEASKTSWKDELILMVWVSPMVMAWFDPERAMAWIDVISGFPIWWQVGMFGMIAASFGLRWFFKQQGLKLQANNIKKIK